jgi:hypothetical protein
MQTMQKSAEKISWYKNLVYLVLFHFDSAILQPTDEQSAVRDSIHAQ